MDMNDVPQEVHDKRAELAARGKPGFTGYGMSGRKGHPPDGAACMFPPYDTWAWENNTWRLTGFGVRVGDVVWWWEQRSTKRPPEVRSMPASEAGPRW